MAIPTAYMPIPASYGFSTVLPDMDVETYSEAGYIFDESANKWRSISTSPPHGLGAVGAAAYSEHPSTEVLSLAYNLKDDIGRRLWLPGMAPPQDLFDHIAKGGLIAAWNSIFEYFIWCNVCHARMGWPVLPFEQLRDDMAKSYFFSLPGKLEKCGEVLNPSIQKLKSGTALLNKFSKPRNPTKNDPRRRIRPYEDTDKATELYQYNLVDIQAESAISALIPDLPPDELDTWLLDQKINIRGVYIDVKALEICVGIFRHIEATLTAELSNITGNMVNSVGETKQLVKWLGTRGIQTDSVDKEHVQKMLTTEVPPPPDVHRVLEIRSILSASSVKKLFSIQRRLCKDNRIRGLFQFSGADRTKRFAGRGPQPQNLKNSGPKLRRCDCGLMYLAALDRCPNCQYPKNWSKEIPWGIEASEHAFEVMAGGNLQTVEKFLGDPIDVIAGCLRGLFCAAPGKDLICSDYSAIEAVVLAVLAGEQWRIDVFNDNGKIYEMSASKSYGVPFEEFIQHKESTGHHHPLRKKGKVRELACGYQGSVGAQRRFGAEGTDAELLEDVRQWRRDSPQVVKFWYKIEDAARSAIQYPEQPFSYRGITYQMHGDILFCQLVSGMKLVYHQPRLTPAKTKWGRDTLKISYMGWNSNGSTGPAGWVQMDTYGGKLVENIVQATSRCILTHAMKNIEAAGYPIVLHVHDEIVSEVPKGFGSVEEFERIMSTMPPWAEGWPVRAKGGWRGLRYRKD